MWKGCLLLFPLALAADAVAAQGTAMPDTARRSLRAVRVETPPTIDGRLDESAWQDAPVGGDFVQFSPHSGAPPLQQSTVRVVYDDETIYVGVRLYDDRPDSIVARLARRDNEVHSDWVYIGFDGYADRRSGFAFGVNPRGVKVDVSLFNDTGSDEGWDAVWDVATTVDSLGWTAEYAIPLSQLRYAPHETQTWGFQVKRTIARHDEESFWSPTPRDVDEVVSRFGDLHGLSGLRATRSVELMPYTVARGTRAPVQAGDPFRARNEVAGSVGGDLKVGLTSNLTLTATFNPDFGQVEADPSVVNLSAYETFLSERRPFFVEGADIFRFGVGVGDGSLGNDQLFYSRRIGRAPQGSVPGAARWNDTPSASTIAGAAKITGRTASGWSIGVLDAVTAKESAQWIGADGSVEEATVEPLTNYAVARVTRDFRDGASGVGAIATATHRRIADSSLSFLRAAAYAGGIDARHRFADGDWELGGFLLGSHVRGDSSAILRAQRSPARYYQRPDADHTEVDATRTSLTGWSGQMQISKIGGGHWTGGTVVLARSPGFEINDVGYQREADLALQVAWLQYEQYEPGTHLRNWSIATNQWAGWSFNGERITFGYNLNGGLQLQNRWGMHAGVNREESYYSVGALRGGPALRAPGNTNGFLGVNTDRRKAVSFGMNVSGWREDGTGGRSWGVHPNATIRPSDRMDLTLSPGFSANTAAWQYITSAETNGGRNYVFGELEQRTASLTTRLNYTFSPDLSLQFYAQPFISAGRYRSFTQVADPRGRTHAQRFAPLGAGIAYDDGADRYDADLDGDGSADTDFGNPDFNLRELRTNAVLRWEYRPGSSLFVVWSHGRGARDGRTFDFTRDVGRLMDAPQTNVLALKISYWFGL